MSSLPPKPKTKKTASAPITAKPRELDAKERAVAFALTTAGTLAERFGFAFMVLVMILAVIAWFGDAKTKNDFVRELLFHEVTHTRFVQIFFVLMIVNVLFGFTNVFSLRKAESKEMQRLADEKSRLQEKALGVPLHHTDDGPEPTPVRVAQEKEEPSSPAREEEAEGDSLPLLEASEPAKKRR